MTKILKKTMVVALLSTGMFISCIPAKVKSLRLYERDSGNIIHVILTKGDYNQGTIYTSQYDADQRSEIFSGEYHISGRNFVPDKKTTEFMNQAKSISEEYGFGQNSGAKPMGTGIMVGSEGTVIEIIFYDVQGDLKSADGIGKDNNGKYYRVYLSEEEI